jgi:hypothetical protein
MKPFKSPDEQTRFRGPLRHYHRSASNTQKTWDEWADGTAANTNPARRWLKIGAVVIATLGLATIIAALIIELR